MSIGVVIQVFHGSKSKGNDRLVLLAIADEADDYGGNAFPSIRRIAKKANCNPETVTESIKRLEALGELKVMRPEKQGRGHFNRYQVILERVRNSEHLSQGSVEGSVEGLVRTDPYISGKNPRVKSGNPRVSDRSVGTYPQGLFDSDRHSCDQCDGGWTFAPNGDVSRCRNLD